MSKRKKFDAVEMKHAIQEKLYVETKGMTWEQERDHRRKRFESGPLAEKWKAIQEQQAKRKKGSGPEKLLKVGDRLLRA